MVGPACSSLKRFWLSHATRWRLIVVVITFVLIWLVLLSEPSLSQEPPSGAPEIPSEHQSRSNLSSSDISSEKVNQFVQAYLQVLQLVDQREEQLQAAETELESLKVEQEIEAEAMGMIEAAGLTWQEYLQLLGLVNIDPEFGERIAAQLQELS